MLINSTLLQLSRMFIHRAAILDFEVGEVLLTFRVGIPTSGGVPVERTIISVLSGHAGRIVGLEKLQC